jgi:hypothetical protein
MSFPISGLDPSLNPSLQKVISGQGGYIELQDPIFPADSAAAMLRFDVTRWELEIDPRLIERTNTTPRVLADGSNATRIGTRYRATVPDPSWKIELPWDDNQTPASVGLYPGVEVKKIILHMGTSSQGYAIYLTTVGTFGLVNDVRNDVVRLAVEGKGGDIEDLKGNELPTIYLDDGAASVLDPASTDSLGSLFDGGGTLPGGSLSETFGNDG